MKHFHTFMFLWRTSPPQYVQATALLTQSFSLCCLRCLLSMVSLQAAHFASPYWQLSSCAFWEKLSFLTFVRSLCNGVLWIERLRGLWIRRGAWFFDSFFRVIVIYIYPCNRRSAAWLPRLPRLAGFHVTKPYSKIKKYLYFAFPDFSFIRL